MGWNPQRVSEKGSIGRAGKAWDALPTAEDGRAAQGTGEDVGCLRGPLPIKGEAGRADFRKRRDFLVFTCWPISPEEFILGPSGKYCKFQILMCREAVLFLETFLCPSLMKGAFFTLLATGNRKARGPWTEAGTPWGS